MQPTRLLAPLAALALAAAHPALAQTSVRRDALSLTPAQRQNFVDAVLEMKRMPSTYDAGALNAYDYFVALHLDASNDHASQAHKSPGFFPWHRELLLRFESELQRASTRIGGDAGLTLPYWDWTVAQPGTPGFAQLFGPAFLGGNGTPSAGFEVLEGPFGKLRGDWRINVKFPHNLGNSDFLQRGFGTIPGAGQLPTEAQVQGMFSRSQYDVAPWSAASDPALSFRNYIEGFRPGDALDFGQELHGGVHLWMAGNMMSRASPNDPAFWLHHANVDRLWTSWQAVHGATNFPDSWHDAEGMTYAATDPMAGFTASYADRLDPAAQGYSYDVLVTPAVPEPGALGLCLLGLAIGAARVRARRRSAVQSATWPDCSTSGLRKSTRRSTR